MAISIIKQAFQYDIDKVWDTVTNLNDFTWRSDIVNIEIIDDNTFIEYTKEGYKTNFFTTKKEYCKIWTFDIENSNIKGKWTGIFTENNGQTEIEFIEEIQSKKIFIKPFVKAFLRKQQKQYIIDLEKALLNKYLK